jgi:hypothetical protein
MRNMQIRKVNTGRWEIDGMGSCGMFAFENVVTILEPLSKNPGIQCTQPFGLRGMKQAISMLEKERATLGMTTLQ